MQGVDWPWRPFSVLIAGDSPAATRDLEEVLEGSGYAVLRSSGAEAVEAACTARPDAVIFDVGVSRQEGLEACRQLCGDPRFPATTPVIFAADGQRPEDILAAYLSGVWHVYDGPIDRTLLLLKLQTFMRARVAGQRVRGIGMIDEETGLYTSDGLMLRARETGALVGRRQEAVACLAFTVEPAQFPASIETVADLLRRSATMARQCTRAGDVLARVSETEIVVIAPGADTSAAVRIAERLQAQIATWAGAIFRCVVRVAEAASETMPDVGALVDEALETLRGAVAPGAHGYPALTLLPATTELAEP